MLNKNIIITLPTRVSNTVERNSQGEFVWVHKYNRYRFSLEEAIDYIIENKSFYMLIKMIEYNVPLRDRIREIGLASFSQEMRTIFSEKYYSNTLDIYLDDLCNRWSNHTISDFDIQIYALLDSVTILGHDFSGLQEIASTTEALLGSKSCQASYLDIQNPKVHVGELYERYPCFDSDDYVNENRYYVNYLIRDHKIQESDLLACRDAKCSGNACRVNEKLSHELLPMVYYDGDSGFMLVATLK